MSNAWTLRNAQMHFQDARRKALLSGILDTLLRHSSNMI